MSNNVANLNNLDKLPTDKLESLLGLDIDGVPGVDLDPDTILYILEVIQKREEAAGTADNIDAAAAWDNFKENYMPLNEQKGEEPAPKRRKNHLRLKRMIISVAAAAAILVGGAVAVNAAHVDLWGDIVQWASDTFGLENKGNYSDIAENKNFLPCKDLQAQLSYDHIVGHLVPTWLPSGFTQISCDRTVSPQMVKYRAKYSYGQKELVIQIFAYSDGQQAVETYEKLPDNYTSYTAGGIDHYIAKNNDGSLNVLWNNGNCECDIYAQTTEAEIKEIIESMYGG